LQPEPSARFQGISGRFAGGNGPLPSCGNRAKQQHTFATTRRFNYHVGCQESPLLAKGLKFVVLAALHELAQDGQVGEAAVQNAMKDLGINPDKPNPVIS